MKPLRGKGSEVAEGSEGRHQHELPLAQEPLPQEGAGGRSLAGG